MLPSGYNTDLLNRFVNQCYNHLANQSQWLFPPRTSLVNGEDAWKNIFHEKVLVDDNGALTKTVRSPHAYIQKLVVAPNSNVIIMGDIHGSIHSLNRNLDKLIHQDRVLRDDFMLADNTYMIFLGDYTDRGRHGLEVWITLMKLYCTNPGKVVILRGNHENMAAATANYFIQEAQQKLPADKQFWWRRSFDKVFGYLPRALLLGCGNNFVLCCQVVITLIC